ncbi:hypothetical protein K1719_015768 [Acacia pycnantha]|nr:hypothetical protein K1719_015768 [Acacia pycnantha]
MGVGEATNLSNTSLGTIEHSRDMSQEPLITHSETLELSSSSENVHAIILIIDVAKIRHVVGLLTMHCGWQFSVFAPPSAGDRPVSRLMVAVSPITSSRDLNRTRSYKSLFRKWFSCNKKPSYRIPSPDHHVSVQEGNPEEITSTTNVATQGFRSCDASFLRGVNNKATSPGGKLFRHKSLDKCFASISPLSEKVTRKSRTATTSSSPLPQINVKIKEKESNDSVHNNPSTPRSARRIMYSNSSGMLKPPPIEQDLECTLEDLCFGCKKKISLTRHVHSHPGETVDEEDEGKQKKHELFSREGDDLVLSLEIPLVKALTGSPISVPLLGGQHMDLTMDDQIVYPGFQKILTGLGMPMSRDPEERGDLRITFLVQFPTQLTHDQRSRVVGILQNNQLD